jgi:glycolate oxidase
LTSKNYNKVSEKTINELKTIVGDKNIIYLDQERLEPYSYDEGYKSNPGEHRKPEVVVMVNSKEEISEVMKLANREMIPVTPRGAGSGLTGGAVPVHGGIVLAFEKMNRIIELDRENLMVTVEPGVITNELNNLIAQEGLFFAGYPMSAETCFIGGNVAENAGGGRAIKYGVTARYVLGLEVVLPSGDIVNFGGKLLKNVTGYNLLQLIVGSEGTLGLVTKVTLKLLPLPKARSVMLVFFEDLESAIEAVPAMISELKTIPSSIEFMDKASIDATYSCLNEKIPCPGMEALLLIEVDGNDQDMVRQEALDIGDYLLDRGALDAIMAETPGEQEKLWKIRSYCPEALYEVSDYRISEDLVVPPSNIPEMVREINKLAEKYNVVGACMGHVGDGNVHAILYRKEGDTLDRWNTIHPELLADIYRATKKLGGTISGEHGVGSKRLQYLPLILSDVELELMRKIKDVFDPNHILNPGKIISLS